MTIHEILDAILARRNLYCTYGEMAGEAHIVTPYGIVYSDEIRILAQNEYGQEECDKPSAFGMTGEKACLNTACGQIAEAALEIKKLRAVIADTKLKFGIDNE